MRIMSRLKVKGLRHFQKQIREMCIMSNIGNEKTVRSNERFINVCFWI